MNEDRSRNESCNRTKYSYDLLNDLKVVTQNAQGSSQTRTYQYDDLGRMTSETNPETGTTTYTYDTDTTCGTYTGDLVKKIDQVGNVICHAYDKMHRLTSVTYPSGSYASVTPSKYFVYDSATVDSVAMSNAKSRVAEAYTCFSPCSSKLTDLGFSYTARGQIGEVYEYTPNSGGYDTSTATYWANGVLDGLTASTGYETNYGVDGEGRVYSTANGAALASTSYNAASEPTALNLAWGDSDTFGYDAMDRMNQYSFNVNGQSVVGKPTWNPNGSLGSLAITDPFNSSDAQTCNYSHDDLARILSVSCGTIFSDTYTYDPFGNIKKSGSPQNFQPSYSETTNHITTIGSFTATYDANGNVTNDGLNSYSWDSNGRPVTVNGVGVTYDALGRAVELSNSGTYTQVQYSPTGFKMQLLNGSTPVKAFVPMPGGGAEVWTATANYYRHPDWLGSSRLASNTNRTVYYDGAYGPFGEPYAQSGTTDLMFTGMDQDISANVYDFPAREYGIQGRWPSPDPGGISSVHLKDPQTLNRYAYVRNNPLALADPTGLDGCSDSAIRRRGAFRMRPHAADNGDCGVDWCDEDEDCGGGGGGGGDPSGGGGDDCTDPSDPSCGGAGDCADPSDPSCGGEGTNCNDPSCDPNQPDPNDPTNQCTNAVCSSTTTCGDSGCSNTTVVDVQATPDTPLTPQAVQVGTMVGNMFPDWLTAPYFPDSVCTTVKWTARIDTGILLAVPATADVTGPIGVITWGLDIIGCP